MTQAASPESRKEIEDLRSQLAEARGKLAEAQDLIRAIQSGDVDAVVVSGPEGEQVFTLRGAEYAYRALVEDMNEGAATIAADGAILYCNRCLSDLLRVPIERIIGKPAAAFFCSGGIQFEELFRRAMAGEVVRMELRLQASNNVVPVLLSLRRMKDPEPATVCMVVSDLTESKQWEELLVADKALRESESQLRDRISELTTIMDMTPAITFIARDARCENVLSSKAGYDFLRLPLGSNASLRAASEDGASLVRILRQGREISPDELPVQKAAASGQEVRDQELTLVFPDNTTRDIFGSAVPLFNEQGRTRGAIGVFIDVTERNRIESALRQNEKLAAAGRLAASIAHEINNPLESLTNLLFLISSSSSLEEVRGYVRTAEQEMMRVSSMVTQTLRFYRQTTRPVEIAMSEVLDVVLAINQPRFVHANIEVVRQYRTDEKLLAYDGELRHLFANLIGNAFDAVRSGGRIFVRLREETDMATGNRGLCVTIADTGHGMERATVDRIFQPFFSTKGSTGTGLGLWIVESITNRHGGTIRVRSRTGRNSGTVFSVFLPFGYIATSDSEPQSTEDAHSIVGVGANRRTLPSK